MFVTKPGAPAEPLDTRRCVPASVLAGHGGTEPRYCGSSGQDPGPCLSPRWFCAELQAQLAAAASPTQSPASGAVGQCSQGLVFLSGSATVSSGCCMLSLLPGQPVPLTQTTALFWELFWTPATDLNMPQPLGSAQGCRGAATFSPLHPRQGRSAPKALTELTCPPGTAPQITGAVTAPCPPHILDQTLGVSQPVPFSSPQQ